MQTGGMMVCRKLILAFVIGLVLQSCGSNFKNEISEVEYKTWYSDHHKDLIRQEVFETVEFNLDFIPAESQYIDEKEGSKEVVYDSYKDYTLFRLGIKESNGKLLYPYLSKGLDPVNMTSYFSFDFQRTISVEQGDKVFKSDIYHYLKGLEQGKNLDFMIGFIGVDHEQPFDLVIDDEAFGNGRVKFHYEPSYFDKIPTLKS